eukprot:TRINITY_DN12174_c0_g1_i2.p1 TRINITY_DN12174_c0_g1~~TRINITY_DN12174_c0_g1_i2.p1  ORF type:complete len:407 (+),score=69.07 TRINITY_DN12174_c0_g1_i2:276-1496(+)
MPHLLALVRVVGRTNLPLVVGECLENLNLKIANVLIPYVRELLKGMPQSSKLPLFQYMTFGNFENFRNQLVDLMRYPELMTAFQHFKEFGNTIALLSLLEQALSVVDTDTFVQAAPFLGITPENINEQVSDSSNSPLYKSISGICSALGNDSKTRAPGILKDIADHTWKADQFYRPSPKNMSLLKAAFAKLDATVSNVSQIWANPIADNGVLPVDSTNEFYRLWSALQFVYCLPVEKGLSRPELFGDGFPYAGITLIYFLRQQHRFQVFDFSYHIINVEEAIPTKQDPSMTSLFAFLPMASKVRELNDDIFNVLSVSYPIEKTQILILHPPAEEHGTEFITSAGGDTPIASHSNPSPLPRDSTPAPLPRDGGEEQEEAYDEFAAPMDAPPPLPRDGGGAPPPLPRD